MKKFNSTEKFYKSFCVLVLGLFCVLPFFAENAQNNFEENTEQQNLSSKIIVLVCGYGFNEKEYTDDFLAYLDSVFGLEKNGGIIRPVIYPDDFKVGSKIRVSSLKNYVSDDGVCGLILLGAPEFTADILADVKLSVPIYSFFSQDEILSSEFVSNFLVESADTFHLIDAEQIYKMTESSIQFILSGVTLKKDMELKNIVKQILGTQWIVKEYTNPETGIKSVNHFVIESLAPARVGTLE